MGGNVKDAYTSEPTTKTECKLCENEFEHKHKYSRKICSDCKERENTLNNLTTHLDLHVNTDTSTLELTATIESNTHERISIDIPTEEKVGRERIIGTIRIEGDNGAWYEDALVTTPSLSGGPRVKGTLTGTFEWPPEELDNDTVRNQYQSHSGNLLNADTLTATLLFNSELENKTTTTETPNYLVNL